MSITCFLCLLMIRRPPRSTRTDTLFPCTTLCRSAVELAHGGEVGDLDRHLDAPLVLAGDLALAQEADRLAQGHLAPGGLVEQGVELVADRRQLQPGQIGRAHV